MLTGLFTTKADTKFASGEKKLRLPIGAGAASQEASPRRGWSKVRAARVSARPSISRRSMMNWSRSRTPSFSAVCCSSGVFAACPLATSVWRSAANSQPAPSW